MSPVLELRSFQAKELPFVTDADLERLGKEVVETSVTEITTFADCRQKHEFSYTELLRPKRVSVKLRIGTYVHRFMEGLYLTENKGAALAEYDLALKKDVEKAVSDGVDAPEGESLEIRATRILCEEYADRVFPKDAEEWAVIDCEQWFVLPILETEHKIFVLRGKTDGVWRKRRQKPAWKVLTEHKTAKSFSTETERLLLDFQMSAYLYRFMLCERTTEAMGLYNVIRKFSLKRSEKKKETEEEYLVRCRESVAEEPKSYFIRTEVRRTAEQVERFMRWLVSIVREIYLSPGGPVVYPNPQERCNFMCDFRDVCIENTQAMREQSYEKRVRIRTDEHE